MIVKMFEIENKKKIILETFGKWNKFGTVGN